MTNSSSTGQGVDSQGMHIMMKCVAECQLPWMKVSVEHIKCNDKMESYGSCLCVAPDMMKMTALGKSWTISCMCQLYHKRNQAFIKGFQHTDAKMSVFDGLNTHVTSQNVFLTCP